MEKPTTQDTFPILGMSCAACAARVDKTLNKQPGVCQASVNYAAATALVEYDPSQTSPEALQHAVQEAGYDLVITHDEHTADEVEEAHRKKYQSLKQRTTWAILLAIPIAVIGMGFMDRPWAGWSTWLLSTPVVFWLGRSFFAHTWKQLRHGSANMDTLVASSTGVAYLFSVFNLRIVERHHRLHPAGTVAGRTGQGTYLASHQETDEVATQDGDDCSS